MVEACDPNVSGTRLTVGFMFPYVNHLIAYFSNHGELQVHFCFLTRWHRFWFMKLHQMQHSGILHIALGCWALLVFGPKVCRSYGPFTFLLIYLLGGISGNLTSFLHTPELTVGGTVSISSLALLAVILIRQCNFQFVLASHENYKYSKCDAKFITEDLFFPSKGIGTLQTQEHIKGNEDNRAWEVPNLLAVFQKKGKATDCWSY